MYVFAFILGVWLLPKAQPLTCYDCSSFANSPKCNNTKSDCSECGTMRIISDVLRAEMFVRRCYTTSCVEGSLTTGSGKLQSTCCKEDRCNSDSPAVRATNVAKCFVCDKEGCTKPVKCAGEQDKCFTAKGYFYGIQATVKGCASKNLCSMKYFAGLEKFFEFDTDCCTGDLCNKASSTTPKLLVLLVPLICSVFF